MKGEKREEVSARAVLAKAAFKANSRAVPAFKTDLAEICIKKSAKAAERAWFKMADVGDSGSIAAIFKLD